MPSDNSAALAAEAKGLVDEFGKATVRVTASVTKATIENFTKAENALHAAIDALQAAASRTIPETPKEELQQRWAGMDGAIAFHLIERHADGWGEVGHMMDAWLAANSARQREGEVVRPECMADERAAFERWASDGGAWPKAIEKTSAGQYLLAKTASDWAAWKAHAALTAPATSIKSQAGEETMTLQEVWDLAGGLVAMENPTREHVEALLHELDAAKPHVPEGYVMVPKVPTEEMKSAAMALWDPRNSARANAKFWDQTKRDWAAMLAAAPTPKDNRRE